MRKIYCVEDDSSIRELLEYTLRSSGFDVRGFENASDFMTALSGSLPSLVLLDIMLPDRDGMQVLHELRSRNETKSVPVILLTAKGGRLDKIKGLDGGAVYEIENGHRMSGEGLMNVGVYTELSGDYDSKRIYIKKI